MEPFPFIVNHHIDVNWDIWVLRFVFHLFHRECGALKLNFSLWHSHSFIIAILESNHFTFLKTAEEIFFSFQTTCESPQTKVAIELRREWFKTLVLGERCLWSGSQRNESHQTTPDSARPPWNLIRVPVCQWAEHLFGGSGAQGLLCTVIFLIYTAQTSHFFLFCGINF